MSAEKNGDKIALWGDKEKNGAQIILPKEWTDLSTVPTELWVEGIIPSASADNNVELVLEYYQGGNKIQDDKVKITVVEVGKIQYKIGTGTYADVPDPLVIFKGTAVDFKAIISPSGANWPLGKPVWGGTSGASGAYETTSITFNTVSTTSADYKTVTAECGNTLTANVLTLMVETETAATVPTDKTRKKLGVGEDVTLTLHPTGFSPITWFKMGGGHIKCNFRG